MRVLYTLGKILFPKLLHREKTLRSRMRWVLGISGALLILAVIVLISFIQNPRLTFKKHGKTLPVHAAPKSSN